MVFTYFLSCAVLVFSRVGSGLRFFPFAWFSEHPSWIHQSSPTENCRVSPRAFKPPGLYSLPFPRALQPLFPSGVWFSEPVVVSVWCPFFFHRLEMPFIPFPLSWLSCLIASSHGINTSLSVFLRRGVREVSLRLPQTQSLSRGPPARGI